MFSERYRRKMMGLCISHIPSGIRGDFLFPDIVSFGEVNCYPTWVVDARRGIEMNVNLVVRRRRMFGDQAGSGALADM